MGYLGFRAAARWGGVALGFALFGCNSFDPKPTPSDPGSTQHLVIPVDDRAPMASGKAAVPISGGTLTTLPEVNLAVASIPEMDQVSIIDLQNQTVRANVTLLEGDEPGRVVEGLNQRVHVALRRGGAIATIDTTTGQVVSRTPVCKAPRGMAFDKTQSQLYVACADGKLVTLDGATQAVTRSVDLDADLRDVIIRDKELWVTRFKSAEILHVDAQGALQQRTLIPDALGNLSQPVAGDNFGGSNVKAVSLNAAVAWRTVPNGSAGAVMVHQQEVADPIDVPAPSAMGSAYGGDGFCGGIVKTGVTVVSDTGTTTTTTIAGAPLPVDVAVSPTGDMVAVAHAGQPDGAAPRPFVQFQGDGASDAPAAVGGGGFAGGSSVSLLTSDLLNGSAANGGDCQFAPSIPTNTDAPVVALAFTSDGRLIAQTMDPPQLLIADAAGLAATTMNAVALPGAQVSDTGHQLFHRDAGGGIACASCHPEGGEDGHVWNFTDSGLRRTQALHVGLKDTAPFHWNGDLENVGALMSRVFVGRMGGVRESDARVNAFQDWVFSIKEPPSIRDAGAPDVEHGRELFNGAGGCTTCHSGAKFTDNVNAAVDSAGAKLQVPSLIAVGYRAPFMHDGCAHTLLERFDGTCGGNAHGNTAGMSPTDLNDLVAYLESL